MFFFNVLRFNGSNIKKIKKNVKCHYDENRSLKNNYHGNGLLKESYYTSMLGQKGGC